MTMQQETPHVPKMHEEKIFHQLNVFPIDISEEALAFLNNLQVIGFYSVNFTILCPLACLSNN